MAHLRNTNPLGAVDVPLLGRCLEAGEVFTTTKAIAAVLLTQAGNYEPIDPAPDHETPPAAPAPSQED